MKDRWRQRNWEGRGHQWLSKVLSRTRPISPRVVIQDSPHPPADSATKDPELWLDTPSAHLKRAFLEYKVCIGLNQCGKLICIGKDPDTGKDWRQEEKETTEDEMVGWHNQLNGHEFQQAPRDGEGQESLACCSPLDTTERLNNNNKKGRHTTLRCLRPHGRLTVNSKPICKRKTDHK